MLKKEHKEVMSDLQKLPIEISEALNKSKQLIEENESYVFLNSLVLQDLTPLKKDTHALRLENKKLLEEQISLQESCEEVKKLFKEVLEIICDPCAEQHQPMKNFLTAILKRSGKKSAPPYRVHWIQLDAFELTLWPELQKKKRRRGGGGRRKKKEEGEGEGEAEAEEEEAEEEEEEEEEERKEEEEEEEEGGGTGTPSGLEMVSSPPQELT
ncbi:putative disks large-like protein [Cricetulus griseus]|uniref:Putative disks large-like protein n=1 Tax=Cricetulus griseus TaxID=10029 RepID=A0A061IIU7_CRIGR|nr:putative disks large-like protein [Cricetulus griseus]